MEPNQDFPDKNLVIAVIEGTVRENRRSMAVAQHIASIGRTIPDLTIELVDPKQMEIDLKHPDPTYHEITQRADGFFLVIPEYNHSFPGTLKRLLDSEYEHYFHKPVAFAGVSTGSWGGVRAVESIIPVVRTLKMIPSSLDVFFPKVKELLDESGTIKPGTNEEKVRRAYAELTWLAQALWWARESL